MALSVLAASVVLAQAETPAVITTVAGSGTWGSGGDGGPATSAQLSRPVGVAVDGVGNLYLAEFDREVIRRVTPTGTINRVAGSVQTLVLGLTMDIAGFSGDGGPATSAQLRQPQGVAADAAGNFYIADTENHRIRKVTTAGIINTVAGDGQAAFRGDGGPATAASLSYPNGVAVDASGNLYIADTGNQRVRKVTAGGVISTVAGTGYASYGGDGGPAVAAWLNTPVSVAVDSNGTIYIADQKNNRIRKVTTAGLISTVAGDGSYGFGGDGGPAVSAQLNQPASVAVDAGGNLYIADSDNHRIRRVTPAGIINTVAGNGSYGFSGDGGPATAAQLFQPMGVAVDTGGNLYIADFWNHRIRKVTGLATGGMAPSISPGGITSAASYAPGSVSPGEIITIFGSNIGPTTLTGLKLTAAGMVDTVLADTKVLFDGVPTPLVYVLDRVVCAGVSYRVAGKNATEVQVEYKGVQSNAVTVPVTDATPGIFTNDSSGVGQGAIVNEDGSINSGAKPAAPGTIVQIYATGHGQTNPPGVDGQVTGDVLSRPLLAVSVTIGGLAADVLYAGAASGAVAGVLQVNVRVPQAAPHGPAVPVRITVGSAASQPGVTMAVFPPGVG